MQQLRMESEIAATENLFRPQINQRSDKLAQLKQQTAVSDRLYNDAQERIHKMNMLSAKTESDQYTFTP